MPIVSAMANIAVRPLGFGSFSSPYWTGVITDTNCRLSDPASVIPMSDGNVAISLTRNNTYLSAYSHAAVLVIGQDGLFKWGQTVGPAAAVNTNGSDIAVDSSNNIYVIGTNVTDDDVYVSKLNSSGTLQYSRRFSSTNTLGGGGCGITSDGAYLYVTMGVGTSSPDIDVVKWDTAGVTTTWGRRTSASNSNTYQETRHRVAVNSSGDCYVMLIDLTEDNVCVAKWLSDGTFSWGKAYTTATATTSVMLHNIAVGSTGDIYFSFTDLTSDAIHIVKANSSGTTQWSRKLTRTNLVATSPSSSGLAMDSSDNVYIFTTYNISTGVGNLYYSVLAKYNSSGTLQWQRDIYYRDSGDVQMQINDCSMGITGDSIFLVAEIGSATGTNMHILHLPTDGSLTGTYALPANIGTSSGTFTYAASSFTDSSHTLTTGTNPANGGSLSYTASTTSVSFAASTSPTLTTGAL